MKRRKSAAWPLMLLWMLTLLAGCAAKPGGTANEPPGGAEKPSEIAEPADPKLLSLREEIRGHAYPAGMAFLGFTPEDAAESDVRSFLKSSQYAE